MAFSMVLEVVTVAKKRWSSGMHYYRYLEQPFLVGALASLELIDLGVYTKGSHASAVSQAWFFNTLDSGHIKQVQCTRTTYIL